MVTNFEFASASRIVFGAGRVAELQVLARKFGERVFLVTGNDPARWLRYVAPMRQQGFVVTHFAVSGEPTIELVMSGAEKARAAKSQMVIAFGGGSAIDTGKAIAALVTNSRDILDYLEVIGQGQPLTETGLPVIAVPTTAGTGAEVTRNAVLYSPEHQVKVSLRSPLMLPALALVDSDLTHGLPPELTASTGLDAITQLIEPFVSKRANSMTDAFCREALPRAARSLKRAFENGGDASARSDMAMASLCGGLALANAGLGAVHGFAAPIGGMYSVPHGAVCAALLPEVLEMNIRAAQEQKALELLRRFNEVARLLTGVATARAADSLPWLRGLCRDLKVQRLGALGVQQSDFDVIAGKALESSSMKGNPVELTPGQLREILERAF
jgi:alcohol dehydrogenase class IV